ncbi:MAG: MFS transporter [Phycisphaerales bacterium]
MRGVVKDRNIALATLVAALGYFVDIFDLLLFALVRRNSLSELLRPKIEAAQQVVAERLTTADGPTMQREFARVEDTILRDAGLMLDNILQMTGLVLGGILWGVLADRYGRLQMLFGSILVYSAANILNAFVQDIPPESALGWMHAVGLGSAYHQYAVLRFVAGVGLAGELGAGITLVSELVSKEKRGFATTIVATVGILGAVCAYFVTRVVDWRNAFLIGGMLGLALLFLRVGVVESGMFDRVKTADGVGRGAFWMLVWPRERAMRYLAVIVCALPIWYCVGVLVKFCDAIGGSLGLGIDAKPDPGLAIMWCYVGLALGDLASGLLSQLLRSRKRALLAFHALTAVAVGCYFLSARGGLTMFYAAIAFVGFACGYWAVFVTTAAEQFGTNLRATAATTAPNFVRWSAALSGLLWGGFEVLLGGSRVPGAGDPSASWRAAALVGAILLPAAMYAAATMRETFGSSLDWIEEPDGGRREGSGSAGAGAQDAPAAP